MTIDGAEGYFCIDSRPIEVCRLSRSKHCKMGNDEYRTALAYGYCASQGTHYYGYKLHAVCGLSDVITPIRDKQFFFFLRKVSIKA